MEKKGDLASALDGFTRATPIQTKPWLEDLAARSDQGLDASQLALTKEKATREEDPKKRFDTYELVLAHESDPALREKRTGCLVEMGRYERAIALYTNEAPQSVRGRYDFGYALIARGRYLQGLTQWEPFLSDYPALIPQIIAFLPYLARETASLGNGYGLPYRILSDPKIFHNKDIYPEITELSAGYRRYFRYCHMKECWYAGDYARIPALLSPTPRLRDVPLLARLYLNLAETNVDYVALAITYWLTATHNRKLTDALYTERAGSEPTTSRVPLSDSLLVPLAEQIAAHARAGRLTPALKAHWETERRQIERLATLIIEPVTRPQPIEGEQSVDDDYLEYFPCTPAFAREFGFSHKIARLLRGKGPESNLGDEDWLHAGYSPPGQSLEKKKSPDGSTEPLMNPFSILNVDKAATKKEILVRVTQALRDGRHDAKTIAAAQKMLFNPATRRQAEFRYCVDFGPYAVEPPEIPTEDCPKLPYLSL
uniref:Tetratricopeptide repeat-containing protein n=1 Tax=Candidatus Kentrum sp. FW TaxID=2126338 RepID=A0A450S9P0_9GAMM|nr:MAG: hypothetical protein BECKFW1821B_GA0114236_100444 [Candidatus Kentron sp. FW]